MSQKGHTTPAWPLPECKARHCLEWGKRISLKFSSRSQTRIADLQHRPLISTKCLFPRVWVDVISGMHTFAYLSKLRSS